MKNYLVYGLILLVFAVTLVLSPMAVFAATPTLQIISPQPGQKFFYGQTLKFVAYYPVPGAIATVYVLNGSGVLVAGGNTYAFNSSGYISAILGVFGKEKGLSSPGQYIIEIDVSSSQGTTAATVTVTYQPYVAKINSQVVNEQGIPLSGVTVYLYNTTAGLHTLVASATTNSTGFAVFNVIAFNFAQNFELLAVGSTIGYTNASATVSVIGNETVTKVLKLYPNVLNVFVVGAMQNGTMIAPLNPGGYSSLTATEGDTMSVLIEVEYAGKMITTATVNVAVTTPLGVKMYTATPITSGSYAGYYNVTFMLPVVGNTSYEAVVNINATYGTLTSSIYVPVVVQYNYTALFKYYLHSLTKEVQALNQTVYTLMKEISTLNSSITTLSQSLSTVTSEVSTLQSSISTLQSSINNLNSEIKTVNGSVSSLINQVSSLREEVNSLNSKLSSITPLVYGGLIAGIIGLIIAIVAIVLVYRKIS